MDTDTRLRLITGVGEEVITEGELRQLLETNDHPVAYDGFEPSGLAHLPFGVFRPLLLKDLLKAGLKFKLWLADWFALINNKMGGDLSAIHSVGEYFIEVWKAAGVENVQFLWASKEMDQEYWKKVLLVAKHTTVQRATRALTIMGRKEGEMQAVAQYFYPVMQTTDVFHLNVDITQLGVDQRRACILAREVAPKLGRKPPVVVSHHMLMGLEGVKQPEGFESDAARDQEISSKMSKSRPQTAIFVHDSKEEIQKKLQSAFCQPGNSQTPLLDYAKHIVFRAFKEVAVERPKKFGGDITFSSYPELEKAFLEEKLHPLDLKAATTVYMDKLISPIRKHFETSPKAKKLYETVRQAHITR